MIKKRILGKTGKEASVLGFGAMRLPVYMHKGQQIADKDKSTDLILEAYNSGINYFDTAYPYHFGDSEKILGSALGKYRDKVLISSKSPIWLINKKDDFMKYLEESLSRLGTDYIDFYHFHSINEELFREKIIKYGLIDEIIKAKEKKMIRHISFSFHDEPKLFKELIDLNVFETVLCQYNIIDRTNEEAISYAASRGVGVLIMGPLLGGRISETAMIFNKKDNYENKINELALRFVLANKDVSCVLSGMENKEVLFKNIDTVNSDLQFSKEEQEIIDRIFKSKKISEMIPCNYCNYCQPCPEGVFIPKIFKIENYNRLTGLIRNCQWQYNLIESGTNGYKQADACTQCGICEEKCPQKIEIIKELEKAHLVLKK